MGVFRLNRPAKLNSLTKPMLLGLRDALDALLAEGERALVVIGAGEKSFCAGTDLAETREMPPQDRLDKSQMARELFFRLSRAPIVSVAAMNGLAYGGGLELAMACNFRLAMPHVRVSLPEIKLGLLPAYGGTQFLPALVGKGRALEMMLTGRPVDASEALAMGLVSRLADPAGSLLDQALALAAEVTQWSQPAIDGIRRCVEAAGADVTINGLNMEDEVVRRVFVGDDAKEGVRAFVEKRAPNYRHR
ncbi:MAG: enoyl-CoA hydratase-related protein [Burkholderiaceae bacterium]